MFLLLLLFILFFTFYIEFLSASALVLYEALQKYTLIK